jgi:hypothetical protein
VLRQCWFCTYVLSKKSRKSSIKKDDMGGPCSTHERDETCKKCWSQNLKWKDDSENLDVDFSIILENTLVGWKVVDWTHLARDREQWWALVNTVMNFHVPQKAENFLIIWETISFWRRALPHGLSCLLYSILIVNSLLTIQLATRKVCLLGWLMIWQYVLRDSSHYCPVRFHW